MEYLLKGFHVLHDPLTNFARNVRRHLPPPSVRVTGAEETQEEGPLAPTIHNAEDPGASVLCPEPGDDCSGEEILSPGEIVWPKYGRTFCPAQIVSHCSNIKKCCSGLKDRTSVLKMVWGG